MAYCHLAYQLAAIITYTFLDITVKASGVGGVKAHLRNVKTSSFSDDEPAYDTVASDEDYSSLGDRASIKESTIAEHPAEQQLQASITHRLVR